jgi:hypothetical protein
LKAKAQKTIMSIRMRRYNGVHNVLVDSIRKADMDMRPTLYENIVLCGGGTLFRGTPCIYSLVQGLCALASVVCGTRNVASQQLEPTWVAFKAACYTFTWHLIGENTFCV